MSDEKKPLKEKKKRDLWTPKLTMPGATGMPPIEHLLSNAPAEKNHRFESAGEFVRRLATRVQTWRENLQENQQPVILAMMSNGDVIEVHTMGEDSHSGVVVEGMINGTPCLFISHQASFQVLCYTQEIEEEEEPRMIGFHVGGETIEV